MTEHDCPIYGRDCGVRVVVKMGEHDWRLAIDSSWSMAAAWYCTRCRLIEPLASGAKAVTDLLLNGRKGDAA